MKHFFYMAAIAALTACNGTNKSGGFAVSGQIKNAPDQKIYLEELFFTQKEPEVIDTAEIKNGSFTLNGLAAEEGLYRVRLAQMNRGFVFINDKSNISFNADLNDVSLNGPNFASPANNSLKAFISTSDSLMKKIQNHAATLNQLQQSGTKTTDSIVVANETALNNTRDAYNAMCLKYADTTASAGLALFAATAAQVDIEKIQTPLQNLTKRFANHNGIAIVANFAKQQLAMKQQQEQQQQTQGKVAIGSMAPEITMNDVNDKPFSLSQLKGKYVLVDFWASWCGPCRGENPNVVAAYNKYKDKNFTVLGVSLDKDKAAWLKAIADDGLTWQHISDLKYWNSVAVGLYGFGGIPYNVLIDPQGKVIATGLRGGVLQIKLAELLK